MGENAHEEDQSSSIPESPDRRILDLLEDVLTNSGMANPLLAFASDAYFSAKNALLGFDGNAHLQFGYVVYSLPYANGYRVQLDRQSGTKWCCMSSETSLTPMGVRSTSPIPPGSRVVVWVPPQNDWGIILGSVPSLMFDPNLTVPDWLCQGGGTGVNREKAYTFPYTNLFKEGGIIDFSSGRPIDSTILEWGRISDTGIALMIDSFQAYLRVNEMCGLFLNYFDSYTKLAGVNLDIMSAIHEVTARDDEGEAQFAHMIAVYPWEAMGAYASGEELFEENDDKDVQFNKHVAKIDLKDGEEDVQPIYRSQAHGGYLGQGHRHVVLAPTRTSGKQLFSDEPAAVGPDFGVFESSTALDGSHWIRSAKGIFITKRTLIPVPKQKRLPEDQKEGDDKEKDNYKFSGQFGGGDEHKVGDIEIEAANDLKHLLQVAGIFDVVAYHTNWKGLHPFHYHQEDYTVPEESDFGSIPGGPVATQETLDFSGLPTKMYLDFPTPKPVKIDDRYGEVDYFETEAGIALLPDGSIVFYDGYGGQITMAAGSIRFDCPGDIQMFPGRNLVGLAGNDVIARAHDSVDITAGKKDVRIKAQKNLHMLSNDGGILMEALASGRVGESDYKAPKVGEDVISKGIVLRAPKSDVVTWAGDIYLRTGGDPLNSGQIVLDAAQGSNNILLKAAQLEAYLGAQFEVYLGPAGDISTVRQAFQLDSGGAHIAQGIEVLGRAVIKGPIQTEGTVQSLGAFISGSSPDVLPIGAGAGAVTAAIAQAEQKQQRLQQDGSTIHGATFTGGLYQEGGSGEAELIKKAKFTLRDDKENTQYGTGDFKLIESRWHTMVRLNLATGGIDWVEEPVESDEGDQLPWPGKKNWDDDKTLQQLKELTMYDTEGGHSQDRGDDGGPYAEPKLGTLEPVAPKAGFKVTQ
jgi:hypothetical protein